jgi:FMN phosphatase YigB (HAD superfamily)
VTVPVRAILFDLGDTLFALDPLPTDFNARLATALLQFELGDADRCRDWVDEAVPAIRREMLTAFSEGKLEEHDMAELTRRHFAALGLELQDEVCHGVADVFGLADIERFVTPRNAGERLARFSRMGYRLAGVSNTTTRPALLEAFLVESGIRSHLSALVFSSAMGLRKPHPAIYQQALADLDVHPGEAIFVGDRVREDVRGPQEVGMRAVLTHEFRQEDPEGAQPLAVIKALPELTDLLAALD